MSLQLIQIFRQNVIFVAENHVYEHCSDVCSVIILMPQFLKVVQYRSIFQVCWVMFCIVFISLPNELIDILWHFISRYRTIRYLFIRWQWASDADGGCTSIRLVTGSDWCAVYGCFHLQMQICRIFRILGLVWIIFLRFSCGEFILENC